MLPAGSFNVTANNILVSAEVGRHSSGKLNLTVLAWKLECFAQNIEIMRTKAHREEQA